MLGPLDELEWERRPDERPVRVFDPDNREHIGILKNASVVGLDTESDSFHRYFDKVCLIQLTTHECDWFFDPLSEGIPPALFFRA